MTLQKKQASRGPARRDDVEIGASVQLRRNGHLEPGGMDARPAVKGSCPDDCHYCWGPETD